MKVGKIDHVHGALVYEVVQSMGGGGHFVGQDLECMQK